MKNSKRRLFRIFVTLLTGILCASIMIACDCNACYKCTGCTSCMDKEGDNPFIEMGYYPTTLKDSEVTVTADGDYFLGSDGEKYVKVMASPQFAGTLFSDGETTIEYGDYYYFKLEPITWRIINETEDTILLVAENVIDAMVFDDEEVGGELVDVKGKNNYKDSTVRAYLNGEFYDTYFTTEEKAKIKTTTVSNAPSSTWGEGNPNACEDTQDKVFLLAYNEVFNSIYNVKEVRKSRDKTATDYARAMGVKFNDIGRSAWWTRSPSNSDVTKATLVGENAVARNEQVSSVYGLVPAIQIAK